MSSSGGHAGRPSSWIAVVLGFVGFLIGGLGLPLGPNWIMFWAGAAIVVVAVVVGLVVDVMSDVVLAEPYVSANPERAAKIAAGRPQPAQRQVTVSH